MRPAPQRDPVRPPTLDSHPSTLRHKPPSCRPPGRTPRNDTPARQDQLTVSGIGTRSLAGAFAAIVNFVSPEGVQHAKDRVRLARTVRMAQYWSTGRTLFF